MGENVKDIVCGMDISTDTEFHLEYEGTVYYFCSDTCQHKFEDKPYTYVHSQDEASVECKSCKPLFTETPAHTHHYTEEYTGSSSTAVYTCPMHPEIKKKGPGTCPICGMALEPLVAQAGEEDTEELDDMTRRFKVSTVLALPVFLLAMVADLATFFLAFMALYVNGTVDRVCSGNSGSTLGRMAIFCKRLQLRKNMESQYVHTHSLGCRCCLALQYGRFTFS